MVMKIVIANLFSPVNCEIKSWRIKVCLNYCWGNVGDLGSEEIKVKPLFSIDYSFKVPLLSGY